MIPKIIHQTWKDPDIPEKWRCWQQSWKIYHPDWGYRLWTHEDIDQFVWRHYKSLYGQFKRLPKQIMRLDMFRPLLMMLHGGLYVDLDFEALKPLDPLLDGRRCVIGKEPYEHALQLYRTDWVPGSAFMASVPGHAFWGHYLECILDGNRNAMNPIFATGPAMLKHAIDTYPEDGEEITVLEPDLLYPMPDLKHKGLVLSGRWTSGGDNATASGFPGAFGVHRWQASWVSEMDIKPEARHSGKPPCNFCQSVNPPEVQCAVPAPAPVHDIVRRLAPIRSQLDYLVICRDSTANTALSIKKATRGLFGDNILVLPEHYSMPVYSTREMNRITDAVIDLGFNQLILSGFPPFYSELVLQIKCKKPGLPVKVLSHGAINLFMYNDITRRSFKALMNLCRKRLIDVIGFNKRDLAETIRSLFGVNAVQYYLFTEKHHVETEKKFNSGRPDVGVLAGNEYRKNIPVQVAAGLMLDNSTVHLVEGSDSGADCLGHRDRVVVHPFLHEPAEFARLLSGMDINFYVTFSESWGLIVSESLIQGVPCLAGDSSGLFDFSEELKSYLVVDEADNPAAICRKALKVLENYDKIKEKGIDYIHYLNDFALKTRDTFLSL